MSKSHPDTLNASRLIVDLQQANQIAQRIYGCLDTQAIATQVTQGLVEQFHCALARIWLVAADRTHLNLVASAGLYSRTDGTFSRVPIGAFKVGKIAQNRVSFLSNNLLDEPWLQDREWAMHHQIQGFAGYPLATAETVVGVLAVFSYEPLQTEFLEVLLTLCTTVTVALGNAIQFQQAQQVWQALDRDRQQQKNQSAMLSDRLAQILGAVPLKLIGTERSLDLSHTYLFVQLTELAYGLDCMTCSLTYGSEFVVFKAIVPTPYEVDCAQTISQEDEVQAILRQILFASSCLGGTLETTTDDSRKVLQIVLQLPYTQIESDLQVKVQCQSWVLQFAFTQMAAAAGLRLCATPSNTVPLITDCSSLLQESQYGIWIQQSIPGSLWKVPQGAKAQIGLDTHPVQLRQVVWRVLRGELWGIDEVTEMQKMLSTREQEVMQLLTQGLRDREIASQLHISESTVKFHINNTLAKFKAKTRVQALYQIVRHGWLE